MKTTTILLFGGMAFVFAAIAEEVGSTGVWILNRSNENEPVRTGMVFPKSPAEKAGIKSDWLVIAVNGTNVVKTPISDVLGMIRGRVGTEVTLELVDPARGKTNKVTVKRGKAVIKNNTVIEITGQ